MSAGSVHATLGVYLGGATNGLMRHNSAVGRTATAQSIAANTNTAVIYTAAARNIGDYGLQPRNASFPDRFYAAASGVYSICGHVRAQTNIGVAGALRVSIWTYNSSGGQIGSTELSYAHSNLYYTAKFNEMIVIPGGGYVRVVTTCAVATSITSYAVFSLIQVD
jgi:hypothetical protein